MASLPSVAVTYEPDEHDELVGHAMDLGGRAFVEELQWRATEAAEAVSSWDGLSAEPEEYRRAWMSAARRLVAVRRPTEVSGSGSGVAEFAGAEHADFATS